MVKVGDWEGSRGSNWGKRWRVGWVRTDGGEVEVQRMQGGDVGGGDQGGPAVDLAGMTGFQPNTLLCFH